MKNLNVTFSKNNDVGSTGKMEMVTKKQVQDPKTRFFPVSKIGTLNTYSKKYGLKL